MYLSAVVLSDFFRSIVVFSPHAGSRRSRPVAWWKPLAEYVTGRVVPIPELRAAMESVPSIRIGPDGETNVLAFGSLKRAALLYPSLFWMTDRGVVPSWNFRAEVIK